MREQDSPQKGQIAEIAENLSAELELTEFECYEYYYYLKRNLFLLRKILGLPFKARDIYVIEPRETYISALLEAFGYIVSCDRSYQHQVGECSDRETGEDDVAQYKRKNWDVMLLLDIIEVQPEHPENFLDDATSYLGNHGRIFLTTENMAHFRNRLKLLLGRSIFAHVNGDNPCSYRRFSRSDLLEIFSHLKLDVVEALFTHLYPPYRPEPLTFKRYVLKYINYFAMKFVPVFRETIFIEARKD